MSKLDGTWKRESQRQWYLRNRDKSIERAKTWKVANPERFNELREASKRRHPERYRRRKQLQRLKLFALTIEEYEQMLASQQGHCAICEKPCSSGRQLAVDHNHKTGQVRGLLCTSCNVSVGWVEKFFGPERFKLRAILRYLRQHRPNTTAE